MNIFTALFFAAKSIFIGCPFDKTDCLECKDNKYGIKRIGHFPKEVKESSGLAKFDDLFMTHPDSGNPPKVWGLKYPFEKDKPPHGELKLPKSMKNVDWEDMAKDDEENLYIGDFGNNGQKRKDLCILKYKLIDNSYEKISFRYPDQTEFPPKKSKHQNFDCEAMIWARGNLYLFSKNRGNKNVKIYKLPDEPGDYVAEKIDSLRLPLQITGADISPNEEFVTLLSYGKVLLYRAEFDEDNILKLNPFNCTQFTRSGQSEAIIFLDEEHLMISNEKGKVYVMYLKKTTSKRAVPDPEVEKLFPDPSQELKELQ